MYKTDSSLHTQLTQDSINFVFGNIKIIFEKEHSGSDYSLEIANIAPPQKINGMIFSSPDSIKKIKEYLSNNDMVGFIKFLDTRGVSAREISQHLRVEMEKLKVGGQIEQSQRSPSKIDATEIEGKEISKKVEVTSETQKKEKELALPEKKQVSSQDLLFEACRELNYEKALLAITQGADVNALSPYIPGDTRIYSKDKPSYSPLSLVAMHGKTTILTAVATDEQACKVASLLLAHGADIDVLDKGDMGNSPLHWAIVTFKNKLTKLFIQHAIDHQKNVINLINQPEQARFGCNPPLILALKVSSQYLVHSCRGIDIPQLLIAAGADVNLTDHNQQSALHWAAILRTPNEFFNLLMENGANYHANAFGKTPKKLYEYEIGSADIDICRHPNSYTDLGFHIVDWESRHPMMRDLDRGTALRYRNAVNQPEVVEMLTLFEMSLATQHLNSLDLNTINEQDHMGRTPLHTAVFYGKYDDVKKLLEIGCDVTIKDASGLTAQELSQKLQKQFSYPVSPTFFPDKETSIRASNCAIWEKIDLLLSEYIGLSQQSEHGLSQ